MPCTYPDIRSEDLWDETGYEPLTDVRCPECNSGHPYPKGFDSDDLEWFQCAHCGMRFNEKDSEIYE